MNISSIRKNYLLHQLYEEETSNIMDCSNNWLKITVKLLVKNSGYLEVPILNTIVYSTIAASRLFV